MRRTASEVISHLESRVARLENRSASTKKVRNPIIVKISSFEPEMEVFCPKSEVRNIEGFGEMHNGHSTLLKNTLGSGANPMCATHIAFPSHGDLDACLASLSKPYTLIESY